jgi:WD40 repeat protein
MSSCQGSWQDAAATAQGCVTRKVPKVPFKVLDAPALQDDFYLNLVDWSSQNVLAVALGPSMYLWSACTSKVSVNCFVQELYQYVLKHTMSHMLHAYALYMSLRRSTVW